MRLFRCDLSFPLWLSAHGQVSQATDEKTPEICHRILGINQMWKIMCAATCQQMIPPPPFFVPCSLMVNFRCSRDRDRGCCGEMSVQCWIWRLNVTPRVGQMMILLLRPQRDDCSVLLTELNNIPLYLCFILTWCTFCKTKYWTWTANYYFVLQSVIVGLLTEGENEHRGCVDEFLNLLSSKIPCKLKTLVWIWKKSEGYSNTSHSQPSLSQRSCTMASSVLSLPLCIYSWCICIYVFSLDTKKQLVRFRKWHKLRS